MTCENRKSPTVEPRTRALGLSGLRRALSRARTCEELAAVKEAWRPFHIGRAERVGQDRWRWRCTCGARGWPIVSTPERAYGQFKFGHVRTTG